MKRFISTGVLGAVLAVSSSVSARANNSGKTNSGNAYGNVVVMCHQPGRLNIEIEVKIKDVAQHLLQGDLLGGCTESQPE